MGGERYDSGAGTIASFLILFIGIPAMLFAFIALFAVLMAVTVGLP